MPRILFIKTSSLGDVVHNCPAVTEAARRVPEARIDWVVEEPFAEVAALHADVRRVIPVAIRYEICVAMAGMEKTSNQQEKELTHGDCRDREISV